MILKSIRILITFLTGVCLTSTTVLSVYPDMGQVVSAGNLSVTSAAAPIAIVEHRHGGLVVIKDDSSKNELTRILARRWGFIYLNRFISQVLRDFKGALSQEEFRKICKAHFSGHAFTDTDWRNIYKIEGSFYVKYSLVSLGGVKTDLVIKYLYCNKNGRTVAQVFDGLDLKEKFISQKDQEFKLTQEEKDKAEKVFKVMSDIVRQNTYAIGKISLDNLKYRYADNDPIEDFWVELNEINKNNPLFSPEFFAEEFLKNYPEPTDEAMKALKYILKRFGQAEYFEIFRRAYIRHQIGIKYVDREDKQFQRYLQQLKFVRELSKMTISLKSLGIMEYLNEELNFVDPVECKNLVEGAEIINNMAVEGIRFDEKKGDFISLINRLSSVVLPKKAFLVIDGKRYRTADCISSGRPKIFPPGSLEVGICDVVSFEITNRQGNATKKIKLNNILSDILGGNDLTDSGEDLSDRKVVGIMDRWIAAYFKNKKLGKDIDPDKLEVVKYFLKQKTGSMNISENRLSSRLAYPNIENEQIRSVLEKYCIKKIEEENGPLMDESIVEMTGIKRERVYVIEKLMQRLEKRIMSEDFKNQHPILQAAEIYLNIIDIHPFNDGNERVARLFMNYYLIINGLPVFEVYPDNREAFVKTVRFVNGKKKFAIFLAEQLMKQNSFMLAGSKTFHKLVSPEDTVKDHLEIFPEREGVYEALSEEIKSITESSKDSVILTSFGVTLKDFYSGIIMQRAWLSPGSERFIDLSGITFVLTDEFVGTKQRFNDFMDNFVNNLPEENRPRRIISFNEDSNSKDHFDPDPYKQISLFNKTLDALPGIDLAITSIGVNGHIGYNEMGSRFYSSGRIVDLHKSTLEHRDLGYPRAFTVGISDILKADRVITIGVSDDNNSVTESRKIKMLKTDAINKAIFTFDVSAAYVRLKEDSNFRFLIDNKTGGMDLYWIKFGHNFDPKRLSNTDSSNDNDMSSYANAVKKFHDYYLTLPYDPEINSKNMIIGIDTGWMPELEWLGGVINQISRIRSKDIEVLVGKGDKLAGIMASRAREKGLDRTKIILLGDMEGYSKGMYEVLNDKGIKEKTFMAMMDGKNLKGMTSSGKASYIMIMKWVEGAIKMAFAENPELVYIPGLEKTPSEIGQGIWMMIPSANLMGFSTLSRIYKLEKDVLKNL